MPLSKAEQLAREKKAQREAKRAAKLADAEQRKLHLAEQAKLARDRFLENRTQATIHIDDGNLDQIERLAFKRDLSLKAAIALAEREGRKTPPIGVNAITNEAIAAAAVLKRNLDPSDIRSRPSEARNRKTIYIESRNAKYLFAIAAKRIAKGNRAASALSVIINELLADFFETNPK